MIKQDMILPDKLVDTLSKLDRRIFAVVISRIILRILPIILLKENKEESFSYLKLVSFVNEFPLSDTLNNKYLLQLLTDYRNKNPQRTIKQILITSLLLALQPKKNIKKKVGYPRNINKRTSLDPHIHRFIDVANSNISEENTMKAFLAQALFHHIQINFQKKIETILKATWEDCKINNLANIYASPLWHNEQKNKYLQEFQILKSHLLSFNAEFHCWIDWFNARINGTKAYEQKILDKWHNIPDEIKDIQGKNRYLNQLLQGQLTKSLSIARVIFIGDGEAGKTTIIKALNGEKTDNIPLEHTPGVEVRIWREYNQDKEVVLWDFGGQVIFHSTHKFFLRKRCVYVLVIGNREKQNKNDEIRYWLEYVKKYGQSSPVIIVGNKLDQAELIIDETSLKSKYNNIVGTYAVSARMWQSDKYSKHMNTFKSALKKEVDNVLKEDDNLFSDADYEILKLLKKESAQNDCIEYDQYQKFCKGKIHENEYSSLLKRLDQIGVAIYFDKLAVLKNFVLNPQWLTYGVYNLINQKSLEDTKELKGVLTQKEIEKFYDTFTIKVNNRILCWKGKTKFMIDAMLQFNLCYPLQQTAKFVFPMLLPNKRPEFEFIYDNCFIVSFEFTGILPFELVHRIMVDRHTEIKKTYVWKSGMYLYNNTCHANAVIEADTYHRSITVYIQKKNAKYYEYMVVLTDVIKRLCDEELAYEEYVHLNDGLVGDGSFLKEETLPKAPFYQLVDCLNEKRFFKTKNGLEYDPQKILKGTDMERTGKYIVNMNGDGNVFTPETQNQQIHLTQNYDKRTDDIKAFKNQIDNLITFLERKQEFKTEKGQEEIQGLELLSTSLEDIEKGKNSSQAKRRVSAFFDSIKNSGSLLFKGIEKLDDGAGKIQNLIEKADKVSSFF